MLLKILRLNQFFSKRATRAKERRAKERSAIFKSGLCSFLKRKLEIHSFHPAFPLFYAQNKGANRSRRSLKRVKERFALFCQKMSDSHEKPERISNSASSGISGTFALSNKIICSHKKSCETTPLELGIMSHSGVCRRRIMSHSWRIQDMSPGDYVLIGILLSGDYVTFRIP